MALHYASIPRFHLHNFHNPKGLLVGNTQHLKLYVTKTSMGRQPDTMVVTCSIQPTPLITCEATKCLKIPNINLLIAADIDPATAKTAIGIMGPFLSAFGFLFIVRIVMSWYPKLPVDKFPYVVAYAPTEPILKITRKVIPPLGGVDVTPVVWFGLISFLNEILVGPQGLLVLLSQQIQTS